MADYKSCAWYQKGTCIRDDKSGAPISCADCEDYERRTVFKVEELKGGKEMSVKRSCENCKHNKLMICHFGNVIGGRPCKTTAMEYWELADDAKPIIKADLLHDAETDEKDNQILNIVADIWKAQNHDAEPEEKSKNIKSICNNCFWWNETCHNVKSCCYGDYKEYNGFCGWFEQANKETNSEPKNDPVSHPAHYTSGGIECIDCIKAALGENFMGFLIGNVIKYTYRYKHKNGVQDLEKARWYLDRAIKELTENVEK